MRLRPKKNKDKRIGRISQIISPGYGCCESCKTTWKFVKGHSTWIIKKDTCEKTPSGMFPLCEKCFSEVSLDQKKKIYFDRAMEWTRTNLKYNERPEYTVADIMFSLEVDQKLHEQGLSMEGLSTEQIRAAYYLTKEAKVL